MNYQKLKSQFTPLSYVLIGVALMLAYLLLTPKSSPYDCKVATGQYVGVYAGPDIKYDVMTTLSEGDQLTLKLGKSTDRYIWQEIVTDTGIKGWAAQNWEIVCK